MCRSIRRKWTRRPMRASQRSVLNQVLVQPSSPSALTQNSASLLEVSAPSAQDLVDLPDALNLGRLLSPAQGQLRWTVSGPLAVSRTCPYVRLRPGVTHHHMVQVTFTSAKHLAVKVQRKEETHLRSVQQPSSVWRQRRGGVGGATARGGGASQFSPAAGLNSNWKC